MEQLESLSAQLPDNLQQLAQLDELLAADPGNEELKAIRDDLQQVITVTLELQAQAGLDATAAGGAAAATPAPSTAATAAPAAPAPSYAPVPAAAAASYAPTSAFSAASAASSSLATPAAISGAAYVSAPGPDGLYAPGTRVMAVYAKDGKQYVARIDRVDEGAETYGVTYLEYGQAATVPFEHVHPWRSASADQLRQTNTPVKALYPEDGLFYAASLDGPAPGMPGFYVVKFGAAVGAHGKKKKKVEVSLHDLQINERFMDPRSMTLTSAASAGAKAAAAPLEPELVTPPHLEPQAGDSDAVRQQKARKLKKLRFEHKKAYEEQQTNARKSSWLDFKAGKTVAAGGAKKKAKLTHAPGLAQVQKQSMFATPEGLTGTVGVVGSGRGMTDYVTMRRHVFEPSSAEGAAAAGTQQTQPPTGYRPPIM